MKQIGLFATLVAAAFFALPQGGDVALAAKKSASAGKPLRGVVHPYRRIGGYSYKYIQGVNTRRFVDPGATEQTRNGPFDNGFFFNSPSAAPRGGDSPYMN